jgi:8-oxo-dGTP diphosphatase
VKRVHVAAAVIRDGSGQILIARRADSQHQGGLWEFPGGKVEADESVETALARELHEELGIVVGAARPLIKIRHDYPDKQVLLDVWEVSAFTGEPHGAEGQPLAWVAPATCRVTSFRKETDRRGRTVTRAVPDHPGRPETPHCCAASRRHCRRIKLIQLRAPNGYDPKYRDLAVDAAGLCAGKAQLMIKGRSNGWATSRPRVGTLLAQLRKYAAGWPTATGVALAGGLVITPRAGAGRTDGVDFVTLSPVQPTLTHPGAEPLGGAGIEPDRLIQQAGVPALVLARLRSRKPGLRVRRVAGIRAAA